MSRSQDSSWLSGEKHCAFGLPQWQRFLFAGTAVATILLVATPCHLHREAATQPLSSSWGHCTRGHQQNMGTSIHVPCCPGGPQRYFHSKLPLFVIRFVLAQCDRYDPIRFLSLWVREPEKCEICLSSWAALGRPWAADGQHISPRKWVKDETKGFAHASKERGQKNGIF